MHAFLWNKKTSCYQLINNDEVIDFASMPDWDAAAAYHC